MATESINKYQPFAASANLQSLNSTMDSSTELTSVDEHNLLEEVNRKMGVLLAPVILYTVLAMLVGTISNPIAIYIYGWKWPNTTTRWFLLWLAIVDLLNCLITMPSEIYFLTSFYYIPNGDFCRLSRFFTYFINNSTAVVFLTIAVDRYIRICHPHRKPMSILGAQIACAVSLIAGVAVAWPTFVLYGRKVIRLPNSSVDKGYIKGIICSVLNSMDNTPYPFAFFIYLCCGFSICFIILLVFYVLIGRVILKRRQARKKRKTMRYSERTALHKEQMGSEEVSPDDKEDMTYTLDSNVNADPSSGDVRCVNMIFSRNGCADLSNLTPMKWSSKRIRPPKSTLMLFAITAVFVISYLPFLIIIIARQHIGPSFYPSLSPTMEVLVNLFSRSYLVNNCTNPIVYGLCNTQFRNEVKKIFCMKRPRRNSSLSRRESNGTGIKISETEQREKSEPTV